MSVVRYSTETTPPEWDEPDEWDDVLWCDHGLYYNEQCDECEKESNV